MALSRREYDDMKTVLETTVRKFLGFEEPTLVTTALNCIDKGYEKRKTIDKLSAILDDAQSIKFAEKLYTTWDDYKHGKGSRHKRRKEERDEHTDKKRKKFVETELDVPVMPQTEPQTPMGEDKIKELMANAHKQLEERRAQIQSQYPPSSANDEASEKQKKAAELQSRIQARLQGLKGTIPSIPQVKTDPNSTKPAPLILDDEGRPIDAKTGQAIQFSQHVPTLKANIRAKKREQFKVLIEKPVTEDTSESTYFDDRVGIKVATRQRRMFKFHEKGKFEQIAGRLRTKAQLERLQSEISTAAKRTGIASATKLATIAPKKQIKEGEIPDVEWWDAYIVSDHSYQSLTERSLQRDRLGGVTNLVEHPIQMKPPAEPEHEVVVPVYLTKKERKKLRRQNRQEAQKEITEKIRLGLMSPPEPKVRMANLMRVLGTEAVQDPTKVEAHVRAQMEKRQRAHTEANAARKLTSDQRREKKSKKLKEDTSLGINVAVYRIRNLNNAARKFKIESNCQQLFMTGLVVMFKDCNIVAVEGGPKQQRKFKRLMLDRIKWSEDKRKHAKDEDDSDSDDEVEKVNKCNLVWEGTSKGRAFSEIKFKMCPTESFAREQFRKCGVEQYWDLAYSGSILETAIEDDF